jgi:3-oxoacyl-[acyl-carrier protein] reductase
MPHFAGERALVTGSASSIGRGIAVALAKEGAHVLLADINAVGNAETARQITAAGGSARTIESDLAKADGHRALLDACGKDLPLHMFVHSASPPRHERDGVRTVSEATWDAMATTNARAGFFLGREIALGMVAAKIPGRLLYLTSLHAGSPRNLAHYSAGKGGMRMVMMELARAFGPDGVRVNALAPGAVPGGGAVSMTGAMAEKIPLGRTGTPDDMARTAIAMLSNEMMPYVTGVTLPVDGGMQLFNWIDFEGV